MGFRKGYLIVPVVMMPVMTVMIVMMVPVMVIIPVRVIIPVVVPVVIAEIRAIWHRVIRVIISIWAVVVAVGGREASEAIIKAAEG